MAKLSVKRGEYMLLSGTTGNTITLTEDEIHAIFSMYNKYKGTVEKLASVVKALPGVKKFLRSAQEDSANDSEISLLITKAKAFAEAENISI